MQLLTQLILPLALMGSNSGSNSGAYVAPVTSVKVANVSEKPRSPWSREKETRQSNPKD